MLGLVSSRGTISVAVAVLLAVVTLGCMRRGAASSWSAMPSSNGGPSQAGRSVSLAPPSGFGPTSVEAGALPRSTASPLPGASATSSEGPTSTYSSAVIPEKEACLQQLRAMGVDFHTISSKRGITTPIQVDGPLGGVRYYPLFPNPLVCDCRFAVALAWLGPELRAQGVTEMGYSGAYSYRMSRVGRLSLHAYGLAIDVHEMVVQGAKLSVKRDYARGLKSGCDSDHALNRVSCHLRGLKFFREFLTPDSDADHHDHFHLSIRPLGEDPVRKVKRVRRSSSKPSKRPTTAKKADGKSASSSPSEHEKKKPVDKEPEKQSARSKHRPGGEPEESAETSVAEKPKSKSKSKRKREPAPGSLP